ncbi:accessory Sec system translocase SecA2 [Rossellomorea sp. YZS02]|uniref:accessory Sec system translocase SecA2 n=1 Tax=Rossellomorea sp. YZS02 TaxID=3097358 RepID=UPI002A10AD68|nr:accessory Sec system translocase SecA2 [Rossellomorea sp. YZS02]MDX8343187.1 accessory Sec system translocase SecA2 [Rossellomorea sp. YZS02]
MINILKKAATSERQLKKYYKQVEKINAMESTFADYSDDQLKSMTESFKEDLKSGKSIADITIDAFAVVREAAKRVLGMRHYDVQLIGGLVLSEGNISEMATGEGKTLVASLSSYLRALEGKGVHVITVNEYLATRDREQIGRIHEFLGMTVGLNLPLMDPSQKKIAYQADITYGVGIEFGFDYLRDNMARDKKDKVQRPYHFAIIDEIDSVLIDEAKTPLIIAGKMQSSADLHYIAAKLAKRFKHDTDYDFDEETKATSLTDVGIEKVEKAFGVDNLYELEHQTLYHYVIQAVRAHVMFERDVDYIVHEGKVLLVDMFTGRTMEGRTLSDGLHQAIEAKEGLVITEENKSQAQITIQNYYRMYPILSGMTGTAKTEEKEFREVYNMQVISIPTNKPKIRVDMLDRVYETTEQKYQAVLNEVKERHRTGQPVLIGTTSILQSEKIASVLDKAKLSYELLNAKSVEQEVRLISLAGQKGQITIATNMAGRGTDILLGEGVASLGGLHVLGTEKHESRRIDNQLRGRSGRQGDPGSSQFFLSLEDDMFRRFASEDLEKFNKKRKVNEDGLIENKTVHELVERTQRIVEGANYSMREYNLKLDDVINEQRNVMYELREKALSGEQLLPTIKNMVENTYQNTLEYTCPEDQLPEEWRMDQLSIVTNQLFVNQTHISADLIDRKEINNHLHSTLLLTNEFIDSFEENQQLTKTCAQIMMSFVDLHWISHLENMTRLKEGIGLRSYQQEDPMRIYAREGLELFSDMFYNLEKNISIEVIALLKNIRQTEQQEKE